MVDTRVTLSGWTLDNPIIPASGTFGFGKEFAALYDINCLGSFSFKGTTLSERFGNPTPRIAETPSGMLNAVGLQNPGVDHVIAHELVEMEGYFSKKVIANVSGFSIDEYVETCAKLDKVDKVALLEVNISCPNVHNGGMAFGTDPKNAYEVAKAVKAATQKPVYIKLSPNVTDITAIARAVEEGGADGVSLINTMLGMKIDLKTRRPLLPNITGGLSGPAILPVAVRMVYQVYKAVSIPIIGMGGVSTVDDVLAMMMAGATAVQVGAANLVNPYVCKELVDGLPQAMEKYNITSLKEIIGVSHNG